MSDQPSNDAPDLAKGAPVADVEAPETEQARPRPTGRGRRFLYFIEHGDTMLITFLAFVCALVVGAVLIVVADPATRTSMGYFFSSPGDTFTNGWKAISVAYSALFRGSIFNTNSLYSNGGTPVFGPICNTLLYATPLILGGLAVSVAFRAGLFNIGVQGQIIIGAIFAGFVGFNIHLPHVIHLVAALIAGIIGGALWGGLAGWLKARTGAHEVITTIMLNYVALGILNYLLGVKGFQAPGSNQAISKPIDGTARLPVLFGHTLNVHFGLIIALLAAAGCWWLLTRSTLGFSLRAIGANQAAARTAGMSPERGFIVVMLISGGLAGLVGCSQILGTLPTGMANDIDGGFGFDAITVALLGRAQPGGTVMAGLLFGAFKAGGVAMNSAGTPSDLVTVIEAVMVLFIAAPSLVRTIFRLKEGAGGGVGIGQMAKGWNG